MNNRHCDGPQDIASILYWSFRSDLASPDKLPTAILINYDRNLIVFPSLNINCLQFSIVAKDLDRLAEIGQRLAEKNCRECLLLGGQFSLLK